MSDHKWVDGGLLLNTEKVEPKPAPKAIEVASTITVPEVRFTGSAVQAEARRVVALWRLTDPDEYAAYAQECEDMRKSLARPNGMTSEKTMAMPYTLPLFVALMMGRFFNDHNWYRHSEEDVQAVLSVIPCSRIGMDWRSSALCDADRR